MEKRRNFAQNVHTRSFRAKGGQRDKKENYGGKAVAVGSMCKKIKPNLITIKCLEKDCIVLSGAPIYKTERISEPLGKVVEVFGHIDDVYVAVELAKGVSSKDFTGQEMFCTRDTSMLGKNVLLTPYAPRKKLDKKDSSPSDMDRRQKRKMFTDRNGGKSFGSSPKSKKHFSERKSFSSGKKNSSRIVYDD